MPIRLPFGRTAPRPRAADSGDARIAPGRHEHRAWAVCALSFVVMALELVTGLHFNSLALISDGLHTSTHVGVMVIAAGAYAYQRRHARDPRFTFGTGKVGDLAAFASGSGLAVFAVLIGVESVERLIRPEPVALRAAALVAGLSLVVGLVSASILRQPDAHEHGRHAVSHRRGRDLNLWAAYLHMVADVITSVLAIAALLLGAALGWIWLDAAVGLVNAAVVGIFAARLLRRAAAVLLDVQTRGVADEVERRLAGAGVERVRAWSVGPGRVVVVVRSQDVGAGELARLLADMPGLEHVFIEADDRSPDS